jgi:hypothetical protein
MAAPVASGERIGDLLVREGLISKEQLDKALQEQKQNGTRVGYNLIKLGFIQETELTKMLARQFKMPAVDLSKSTRASPSSYRATSRSSISSSRSSAKDARSRSRWPIRPTWAFWTISSSSRDTTSSR